MSSKQSHSLTTIQTLESRRLLAIDLSVLGTYESGIFDEGAAEIVAYDAETQRLFSVNANDASLDVLDASDPETPTLIKTVKLEVFGAGPNSVAVSDGVVAVAVEGVTTQSRGRVVLLDTDGFFLNTVKVGALPDMLTFTPNGNRLLVANEGEPSDDYTTDPFGTVSIIDMRDGAEAINQRDVTQAGFKRFNSQQDDLIEAGVRIFGPDTTVARDVEPEYIAISPNGRRAYVSLQENNALAVVNIRSGKVTRIIPLGFKDHSEAANALDATNDGEIDITTQPIFGMYQPDAIATFRAGDELFIVATGEGDARDYAGFSEITTVGEVDLDPNAFPDAEDLQGVDGIADLEITNTLGDTDEDGDFDELYAFGSRSFTIFNTDGEVVFDSGDEFEQQIATDFPEFFNASNDNNDLDDQSPGSGPQPEALTIGTVGDSTYAFIGLERMSGVMVYDITDPESPEFIQYINNRDFEEDPETGEPLDLGPEGIIFIPGASSPTDGPLITVANEVSGTVTIYEIEDLLNGNP